MYIPETEKSEMIYRGFHSVRIDTLRMPDGITLDYLNVITNSDAVSVLAETTDKKFLLNREYRYPVKSWVITTPGGFLDAEEAPLEGGKRELLEETGYDAEEFIYLGVAYPYPAMSVQKNHFVLAKNVFHTQKTKKEPFERIEPIFLSHEEIYEKIRAGEVVDGILCTALLLGRHVI